MAWNPSEESGSAPVWSAVILLTLLSAEASAQKPGETIRVSVSTAGFQSDRDSEFASISRTGRFVAFLSLGRTLVDNLFDPDGAADLFVHDRKTGETSLVILSGGYFDPPFEDRVQRTSLSNSGRYVSLLANTDPEFPAFQVVVHDLEGGRTELASRTPDGTEMRDDPFPRGNRMSGSGALVLFDTTARDLEEEFDAEELFRDVYAYSRRTGSVEPISVGTSGARGNSHSHGGNASKNGRFVVFDSAASTLVANDTNGATDVFVHDRRTGVTTRVSLTRSGQQADGASYNPYISANGRYVVFVSDSPSLVEGDTNDARDVFVHRRARD
jgi:Tol biopolymer transport system component